MRIAPEGYTTLLVVAVFSLLVVVLAGRLDTALLRWVLQGLAIGLLLMVLTFFRDPDRVTSASDDLIISPADGKVVQILQEIDEQAYLKQNAVQVSIFLSPLDVHVNRVPAAGRIEYVRYHPGLSLMAWEQDASELNERADFGLVTPEGGKLLFRQITGFLARRIVYHLSEGDDVQTGDRFGVMKFGSRMDVVMPEGTEVLVKPGDRVTAGITPIARWRSE